MAQSPRRHYRVAQKEIEHAPEKGTFISKEKINKLALFSIVLLVFTFINGFISGNLMGSRK